MDMSVNNTRLINISNCITAREDRGISEIQKTGNGVVLQITKRFLK